MSDQNTSRIFPLETLLLRLEREGFIFGIDQHLRLQKVLQELGKDYLKEPEKLRNILAPILVHTQDGARTFDRVFDEYIQLVVKPSVNQYLYNIEDPHVQDGHIQLDPRVRWLTSISRWILSWVGVVVLLISVGIFLLLPNIQRFLGWTENSFEPKFSLLIPGQNNPLSQEDSVFVGEAILLRNTSLLGSEASSRAANNSAEAYEILWRIEIGESLIRQESQNERSADLQHNFKQEGTYRLSLLYIDKKELDTLHTHRSVQVYCRDGEKPDLTQLNILPDQSSTKALIVNEQIDFSLGIPADWGDYEVEWFLDGEKLSQPSHTFMDSGAYIIRAEASLLEDPNNYCQKIDISFPLTLVHKIDDLNILLNPASMSLDPAGEAQYGFSLWARFLPILLAFVLVFLIDRFRLKRKRKKLLQTYNLERGSISEGPIEIPFPELDHLLSHDPKIFSLANAMRQRRLGDRQKFDIKKTIQDTARSLGLVNLRFLQTSKASEYVIFIEQIHPQSHTARLFSRLIQMLKGEDVLLEVFYFDRDMRICWNEDFPEGIRIEQIQQKFGGHRLLLYSDGENLIDPYEAKLKDWVKTQLNSWKGKSALITHKPLADWGYKERCLSEHFYLLSAELNAQQLLPELFSNEEISGYEAYVNLASEQVQNPKESLRDYDFNQLEDLKLYLGDSHFELLAACMVYPLPSWEVSLSMARTLSIRTGNEYLQTYDTFLRLARIPWMQTGLVSPGLRRELLATLSPETEHLARKTILELLDQVGVKEDSLAGRKLAIQQISNKFLTEPGDAEIARKMYVLWRKNEILDPVVEERLHKKSAQLRGESSDRYLQTRFEVITPMRTLLKALLLGFLVAIGTYKLDQMYSGNPLLKEFSYRFGLEEILTLKLDKLDEASYFNNQGVKAFKRGDMLQARKDFYRAMQYRHYDLLKHSGKENIPINWQEASEKPYWTVLLEVDGIEQKMDFGIKMDERLKNLDKINSIEDFDDALLSSFERSRIFISSDEYVKRFKFVNYPLFNGTEGLLPAYLFNYYYPTAGKNLISLISYNKGVEAFNQRKFYEAKDAFNLSFSLLGAGLVRASPYTHMDLFVESADAFTRSKFYTGDTTGAIALNKILQSIDPKYFAAKKAPNIKFAEYLKDEMLMQMFAGYKKKATNLSAEEVAVWEEMPGALAIDYRGERINLAAPLNIAARKITRDSLRYLGTDKLADPAGVIHRLLDTLSVNNFSGLEFPDPIEHRESWEIANWYCNMGLLTRIKETEEVDTYIKVGSLLFYGGRGKDFSDSSSQKLFRRGGINHIGVVCSVERDEKGKLIRYGVFHAQRPGLIAKITSEKVGNYSMDKEYMAYSYQNNQLLAVAPIVAVKDSMYTENISVDCLDE